MGYQVKEITNQLNDLTHRNEQLMKNAVIMTNKFDELETKLAKARRSYEEQQKREQGEEKNEKESSTKE